MQFQDLYTESVKESCSFETLRMIGKFV